MYMVTPEAAELDEGENDGFAEAAPIGGGVEAHEAGDADGGGGGEEGVPAVGPLPGLGGDGEGEEEGAEGDGGGEGADQVPGGGAEAEEPAAGAQGDDFRSQAAAAQDDVAGAAWVADGHAACRRDRVGPGAWPACRMCPRPLRRPGLIVR